MSKVLQRSMFKKPQHEHRSTGIASGLKYRDGYAVGGRVGFFRGGGPLLLRGPTTPLDVKIASMGAGKSPAPFMNVRGPAALRGEPKTSFTTIDPRITAAGSGNLPVPYNPMLTNLPAVTGGGIRSAPINYNPAAGRFAAGALGIGFGGAGLADLMSSEPIFFPPSPEDDSSLSAEAKLLNAEREADIFQKRQEKMEKERKKRTEQKDTDADTDTDTATDKKDKVEQAIKAINSADALAKTRYEELDAELQSLREKQKDERRTVSLLNILSAANDPNLRQGQSRIGAGVGQLTEEAKGEVAIKQAQDESDIARKYERAEKQIQREAERDDYRFRKQIDVEFGQEGAQVQYMNYLLRQLGIKPETEEAAKFIKEKILGKKGQQPELAMEILESATDLGQPPGTFRMLFGITAKKDDDGNDLPLDNKDLEAALDYIDQLVFGIDLDQKEDFTSILDRVDQRDGGRIGFANGGNVNQKVSDSKIAPIVMGYDQLKAFLPDFISDRIVKLISSNPTAFREFAEIETNKDVDDFNEKYDVRLVLPEREKMEEERVNVASNVMSNVTVPSAVAASPMTMPTQTSTGQLSPTETALLSPTEQAIKMRS